MSSSGKAAAASRLGHLGHEAGKLKDLFRPLCRRQLSEVTL
jgi:hypothetical protein